MKTVVVIFMFLALWRGNAVAQMRDSVATIKIENQVKNQFVDQDGDGMPDSEQHQGKEKMKRDQFIDKNGDGICDSREQGLGFQRMRKQHSEQTGKQIRRGKK